MTRATDEGTVAEWWARWPGANVGVVTGAVSGVAVVDVDPRHGGERTLADLEFDWAELPSTLESRTGGGGRHLWYAMPDEALVSDQLGAGVELKAERGMIVTPPSVHVSGERYRWLDYSVEPAPLPNWLRHVAGSGRPETRAPPEPAPIRTVSEMEEFRVLWAQVGIELVPRDSYYLCPFHDDHHPSLHVDADGCRWYCFACRIGGGIGRLQRQLGIAREPPPRSRLRGRVGHPEPITIPGDAPVQVVGESFHQDELLGLAGGQRRFGGVDLEAVAELTPIAEDGVEVLIDSRTVGFLTASDAERFMNLIEESHDLHGLASCRASIRGGWDRGHGDIGLFGVILWMPPASREMPEEIASRVETS